MEEGGELCLRMSEKPQPYEKGTLLAVATGICGYDIKVVNDGFTDFSFTVLRDSAIALSVGSSTLAFAMLY